MINGIGMLWYDPDPKADLAVKIDRAASYYAAKYGQHPTLVYIHPGVHPGGELQAAGLSVKKDRSIRPNHFWLKVG